MYYVFTLLVISFIIFIHELGHFLAAKYCNVAVEVFSIGFGPSVMFKYGLTTYQLGIIPFGGYVKFYGDETYDDIPDEVTGKDYGSASVGERAFIAIAGPLANVVLAFLLFMVCAIAGIHEFPLSSEVLSPIPDLGLISIPAYGVLETFNLSIVTFKSILGMFTGSVSLDTLGGPLLVGDMVYTTVQISWLLSFFIIGVISLNIGLINLFPIPIFDGGNLLLLGIEAIRGQEFSVKTKERILIVSFIIVISILAIAMYNDINRYWVSMIKLFQ